MKAEYISYEEYLARLKEGILTRDGNCPVTPLLLMLQGRWKSQVMYEMCMHDTVRFGQLKRDLAGITNTMLSKALRELEEDGLISRRQFNEIPPHVEYSLTGMGRDGAEGCRLIRDCGGWTVVEDESTCAVFGMPAAAIELGGACEVLPRGEIAGRILELVGGSGARGAAV